MNAELIHKILFTTSLLIVAVILVSIVILIVLKTKVNRINEKRTCWRIVDTHGKEIHVYADKVHCLCDGPIYLYNQKDESQEKEYIAQFPHGSSYCKFV